MLPPDELRALKSRCVVRTIHAGEILFEEDRPVDGILIILTGVAVLDEARLAERAGTG